MKNILIKAYTRLNLGDDLFIKILCERYPNYNFNIFCDKKYGELTGISSGNLKINKNFLLNKVINKLTLRSGIKLDILKDYLIKNSLCHVNIGGSLFIQMSKDWKNGVKERENEIKYNRNNFIMGANFGPYIDEEFYPAYKKLFKKYTDICFRDDYSYGLFKDLPNVRMSSDIVFGLDIKKYNLNKNYILISVIDLGLEVRPSKDRLQKDNYESKIVEMIEHFSKSDKKVKLMSFCKYEGDEKAIDRIINKLSDKAIKKTSKYFYNGNMDEALLTISNSEFVVATRFHSMILAMIYEKPFYPLIYSKKMTNVLSDIGFDGEIAKLEEIKEVDVKNILENKKIDLKIINDLRKNSEIQFEKLDIFLNEGEEIG